MKATLICRPALLLGCVTLLVAAGPSPTKRAQGQESNPIFLALPESFPEIDARAVLMLEPGRDIVVLSHADADPETLATALGVLRRMRRDHPRAPDRGQLVPITGFVVREPVGAEVRATLQQALDELRERPVANVGNLGPGRWMQFSER